LILNRAGGIIPLPCVAYPEKQLTTDDSLVISHNLPQRRGDTEKCKLKILKIFSATLRLSGESGLFTNSSQMNTDTAKIAKCEKS
jgi:hypothetical protein